MDSEEQLLISYLWEKPTLQKMGVLLMLQTGLRVGELSTLKRSDIDMEHLCIHIRRTETTFDGENGKRIITVSEEPKTAAGDRVVYIPPQAKKTLKQIQLLNSFREWLFSYPDGRRMHGKAFNDQLHRACVAVGIPERSTHKLRKTYDSTLLDNSVNEKLVQKQMGHRDIFTTRKYYSRDRMTEDEKQREIARALTV